MTGAPDAPAPFTPPDCDLRGMPFMPLDVVRLGDSDLFALSTGDEFKAAVALWCKSWLQVPAASLPSDDRILAHLSSTGPAWSSLKDMALRGWVLCSDGRLYHRVVADKAQEAWRHRQAQRERAVKRWEKGGVKPTGSDTGRATPHATAPERDAAGDATASTDDAAAYGAAHAAGDATAHAAAMQGTGTGTVKREGSETSSLPRQAAAAPVEVDPPDARTLVWREGAAILHAITGKSPPACRTMLGKLLRDAHDDCPRVLLVLQQAREARPVDPVAWLSAAIQDRDRTTPPRQPGKSYAGCL